MRIMCIYPGATLPGFASLKLPGNNESNYINHGLSMISAVLKRNGHDVIINDLRGFQDWADFDNQIKSQEYDLALITFMSCDELYAIKCLEIVKKHHPEKMTIAGGIHLSVTQAKSFPYADTVVLGEGEENIIKIINHYQQYGYIPPFYNSEPIADLDRLPFVDRELFNNNFELETPLLPLLPPPFVTIIFSRGCPWHCSFCFPSRQLIAGKKKRARSVDNCIEELYLLKGSSGVGSLMIHDDLFPEDTEWVENFSERLLFTVGRIPFWLQMRSSFICKHPDLIKKLAEAGLTWISLGGESGSERMLKFLKKGITVEENIEAAEIAHRNNINLFFNYILGLPEETKEDIEATEKMLQKIRPAWHSCSIYTAYPGSDLYEYCWKNNLFTGDHYRRVRYPYERKIKGIDYEYIFQKINEFGQYKSELREWKGPTVTLANADTVEVHKTPADKGEKKEAATTELSEATSPFPNHITLPVKSKPPKVSVIMTSYNRPNLLKEAIQSIYNQTIKNWEIIMVDASTDPEVISVLKKSSEDKRVTVLADLKGIGNVGNISRAWNMGLDHAQGEYFTLLDDDNRKKPTFLEELSKYLDNHPEYDAVCCFSDIIDLNGRKLPQLRFPKGFNKDNILKSNYIDSQEIMVRRSALENIGYFDERLTTCDDWDMMIRLIYESKGIAVIEKPLVEYRQHPQRRMHRTLEFNAKTIKLVRSKKHRKLLQIACIMPEEEKLTKSQNQVCKGIMDALIKIPFVAPTSFGSWKYHDPDAVASSDLLLVLAPFQIEPKEMETLSGYRIPIITIHMEDPQAVLANKERDRFATWIVTNDTATISYYQKIIKDPKKILFCPNLSISETLFQINAKSVKIYDIAFCGYPYPSRYEFVKSLLPMIADRKIVLVGNGWDKLSKEFPSVKIYPTQNEITTFNIYRISKIIVCLHRTEEDIGGFPSMKPNSIHRGYIEAYSGALVMIDDKRKQHSFGPDEVVFFSSPEDLREKIKYYLAHPRKAKAMAKKAQMRAARDFTFRSRLTKILNCVRSERYCMRVP